MARLAHVGIAVRNNMMALSLVILMAILLEIMAIDESVASLLGIVIDRLNVVPYFPGPKLTTEGSHVGTGRIPSRLYRGNHTC